MFDLIFWKYYLMNAATVFYRIVLNEVCLGNFADISKIYNSNFAIVSLEYSYINLL